MTCIRIYRYKIEISKRIQVWCRLIAKVVFLIILWTCILKGFFLCRESKTLCQKNQWSNITEIFATCCQNNGDFLGVVKIFKIKRIKDDVYSEKSGHELLRTTHMYWKYIAFSLCFRKYVWSPFSNYCILGNSG